MFAGEENETRRYLSITFPNTFSQWTVRPCWVVLCSDVRCYKAVFSVLKVMIGMCLICVCHWADNWKNFTPFQSTPSMVTEKAKGKHEYTNFEEKIFKEERRICLHTESCTNKCCCIFDNTESVHKPVRGLLWDLEVQINLLMPSTIWLLDSPSLDFFPILMTETKQKRRMLREASSAFALNLYTDCRTMKWKIKSSCSLRNENFCQRTFLLLLFRDDHHWECGWALDEKVGLRQSVNLKNNPLAFLLPCLVHWNAHQGVLTTLSDTDTNQNTFERWFQWSLAVLLD